MRDIHDSSLYNKDLAPVPPERRTWTLYNYASLWVAMSVCIPTYMLASGLIAGGMNWWQAVGTILLGNLIVLVPMLLNAHAGARYGIPFPVLVRASFGVRGANVAAILRAIVACGWFGIQTWIGGQAIHTMLGILRPELGRSEAMRWACFLLFSGIGIAVTSASVVIFGAPVWDPVALLGKLNQPVAAVIALVVLLFATLTTNVAANVVSPANDFSNLSPSRISFRTGGLMTGV